MKDFGNDGTAGAGPSCHPTHSESRTHVLLVEDDARLIAPLTDAMTEFGLEPTVVSAIDDDFIAITRQLSPAAVVVDLLLPTADALRLGRWLGGLCHGPVFVVVPGSTIPTIPDAATDRLRVVRRPVAPDKLARMVAQVIQMRRWNAKQGALGDSDKRTA